MKWNNPLLIIGFHLLMLAVLLFWAWHAAIGDWGNYYYGSTAFVDGNKQLIYDPTLFNNFVESWHPGKFFLSYTQVPPLSLLIYSPFAFLKVHMAKLIFLSISYGLCVFSIQRLFKKLQLDFRWSLVLPILFLLPMKSNAELGQSYFLLVAILAEGWLARENGKWILASLLFAFAIHLKLFPAVLLIWLLTEKDWKVFGGTVVSIGILFGASLAFIDFGIWKYYATEVLPRLMKGEITNTYSTSYQSMEVLLKQLFVSDELHNPTSTFNRPAFFSIGKIIWTSLLLVVSMLFSLEKKQTSLFRFSFWIFAGTLISGYGSNYGLLQLVFCAIAIFSLENFSIRNKTVLLILLSCIVTIPVQWFYTLPIPFSFPRLMLMILLLGMLLFYFRLSWNKWAMVILIIPLFSFLNSVRTTENYSNPFFSKYYLKQEPSLLITDFSISRDTLRYHYRAQDGLHQSTEHCNEPITSFENLKFDAHHIFYNESTLRFSAERITNPVLVNGNTILYLSDKNRGVGFYTIRTVKFHPAINQEVQ